jgi:hypothetical protein
MIEQKKPWTPGEIRQLASLYDEKLPIKMIAREMARTPTAVNKALSRFQIRPTLEQQGKINHKKIQREQREMEIFSALTINYKLPEKANCFNETSSSLGQIVAWLELEGIEVKPFRNARLPAFRYLVNKKPMTDLQVVLLANKRRLTNGLSRFVVLGLTV